MLISRSDSSVRSLGKRRRNREQAILFYGYATTVGTVIYTTNAIESCTCNCSKRSQIAGISEQ